MSFCTNLHANKVDYLWEICVLVWLYGFLNQFTYCTYTYFVELKFIKVRSGMHICKNVSTFHLHVGYLYSC